MKKVIIVHGYGENDKSFWYPYIKKGLEEKRYEVQVPLLPNTNDPKLNEQLEFALKNLEFDKDTILIGHSSGCAVILAILELIEVKIKQAILVAGYINPLKSSDTKNLKENFDFEEIKKNCDNFIFMNSDNDPWGCDEKQGKMMQEKLGGKLIINHEGHMGSDSFNQSYREFPFILSLLK